MTGPTFRFCRVPLQLATVVLISACQPGQKSNESNRMAMEKLTTSSIARCVGRYLIDLPSDIIMHPEGGQNIGGVQLDVVPMTQNQFDVMLTVRKLQLESMFMRGPEGYPFLRGTIGLPAHGRGLIFDRAEDPDSGGRLSRQLELLGWKDGYRISATIKANDTSFPEDANEVALQSLKTNVQESVGIVLDIFNRTTGRADSVPVDKGVCILNGFVRGSPTDAERVTLIYHLKDATDVFFRFNTDSSYSRDDTLLVRSKSIEPSLAANQGRTVRRSKRTVGGVKDGEEFLYAILGDPNSDQKQIMTWKFVFEANKEIGSAATPLVRVDLNNGEVMPQPERSDDALALPLSAGATLSEAEAISLWDTVIPTLRPRPGAF
jgi:hypothetical protein